MGPITLTPADDFSHRFFEPADLPAGCDEYYLRNQQLGHNPERYRRLRADELEVLVKNGNNAEDWDTVLATNLKGTFNLCRLAAKPMFRRRSGRIVNITSVVGLTGNVGQANYAASKGGVIALTYSLAKEFAPRGITVNAVAPGFTATDMTEAMNHEARAAIAQRVPLGRIGDANEIAAAVAFLCGPGASYITGEVLRVDGGLAIG